MSLAGYAEFQRELGRKAFHMLSLVYLAAYHWLGYPRIVPLLAAWLVVVTVVELGRFLIPSLGAWLAVFFSGLIRETELRAFSGIFHTTAGCLIVMAWAGGRPALVVASVLNLALGDAAAALVGKRFGRIKIAGGKKSVEGSLACLAVCWGCGVWAGLPPAAALAGALSATAVELLPTTPWFNDNLWMPVASCAALLAFGGA
ncbi:MAG: hypothetical protein AAB320_06200 [Elusimicrobiota bacterium]